MITSRKKPPLNFDEQLLLAELIGRATWPLPEEVFYAVCERTVMECIEAVIFRWLDSGIEVLLARRPPTDPHHARLWGLPGAVVTPDDIPQEGSHSHPVSVFRRIEEDDLHGLSFAYLRPAGTLWHRTKRGPETAQIYVCELKDEKRLTKKEGTFFSVDKLPADIVPHHPRVIEKAFQIYTAKE